MKQTNIDHEQLVEKLRGLTSKELQALLFENLTALTRNEKSVKEVNALNRASGVINREISKELKTKGFTARLRTFFEMDQET